MAAGAGHVERRIDLVPQILVIGVQAERKPELHAQRVNQVERMSVFVLVLLQHPRLRLRAAVGKNDANQVVLDDRLDFAAGSLGNCGDLPDWRWLESALRDGFRWCSRGCGLRWRPVGWSVRFRREPVFGWLLGLVFEEKNLADDDQRKGDGEHHQHAAIAAGLLLWVFILGQV